jgi:hypothetical protein
MEFWIAVLIAALIFGLIGAWIARKKGRDSAEGFALGFFLSAIGLIIEGLLPEIRSTAPGRPQRKCPYCAEMVLAEAILCKHCHKELPKREIRPTFGVTQSVASDQSPIFIAVAIVGFVALCIAAWFASL